MDRSFVDANTRELERMRRLVERLDEESLTRPVNEHWTVAAVLGHIAFWDGRARLMADKLDRGGSFTAADGEPKDVDWINDASRPLIHAIPPRPLAELAVRIAEDTDTRIAGLPTALTEPLTVEHPLNPLRAGHRGAHLNEIEAALGS